MGLAVAQLAELGDRELSDGVGGGADGQREQHLVEVEHGVGDALDVLFHGDDGLEHDVAEQVDVVADAGEVLDRVEHGAGVGVHDARALAGDDLAVGQLYGERGAAGLLRTLKRGAHHAAILGGEVEALHHHLDLLDGFLVGAALGVVGAGAVVAANDLLLGGFAHHLVVEYAVAGHVDTHIGGRLVDVLTAHHLGQQRAHHGEGLQVAVVVDGGGAVGLQMEVVDHVDVLEVGGGGLVGEVDGMLEGQVPDGEGLKLGIARLDAALDLVVDLRQANGQLAGAGAGRGDHDERARGLDKVVLAIALVGGDEVHVHRIALDGVVVIGALAAHLQHFAEGLGGGLTFILRDDHGGDIQTHAAHLIHQAQHVHVVGNAQISAQLAVADVGGVDAEYDLGLVAELLQQADLGVGLEARQHAGGVQVVEQLAAKLEVQFVAELADALADGLGLLSDIQIVVKAYGVHVASSSFVCYIFSGASTPMSDSAVRMQEAVAAVRLTRAADCAGSSTSMWFS